MKQLKYRYKLESTGRGNAWFIYLQTSMGTWIPACCASFASKEDAQWFVKQNCR